MPRKSSRTQPQEKQSVPFWDALSPRIQHAICLFILLLLPMLQYPEVIPGNQRFMAHDIVQWRASAETIIQHRETYGEEPLWASNMFSGMPAYIVSFMRTVPHVDQIFTWLNPIFPAAPIWILTLGVYLFLLRLKLHPLAALLGAVLAGLTTYMPIIVGAGHNAKVYALSFIPWMLYGFHLLTRSEKKLIGFAVFAIATNLELRAGHPQVTYFFLYLFAIWWIHDLWFAYNEKKLPEWAKNTGLLICAGILALAANLQPYWSIYEYSPFSIRGGTPAEETVGLDLDYAMEWSHGWFEMSTLFIPGILGGSSQGNVYWGDKIFTSGPHYLGAIAFFLILIALFRVKSSLKWVFLASAILTMLFALGKNFSTFNFFFFNYMPFFNKFRAPEMWLMVSTLSLITLAAMGAHWLLTEGMKAQESLLKKLDWPAGITIGTGILYLVFVNGFLSFERPGEFQQLASQVASQNQVSVNDPRVQQVVSDFLDNEVKPERISKAQSDTLRFLLFSGIGILLAGAMLAGKLPGWIAIILMSVLLMFDLVSTGNRYIAEGSKIPKSWDIVEAIERQRGTHHTFIQQQMAQKPYPYRVFPLDSSPFNNAVPAYFFHSIGGYTGAKMNRYQELIDNAIFHEETGLNFGVLDMLNVAFLTARQAFDLPGYTVVHQGDAAVLRNETVLPKVFFPNEAVYVERPAQALQFLQGDFDPRRHVVLETQQQFEHQADSLASFEMLIYNARSIEFNLTKTEPGWVVLSETYYPKGWVAKINGEVTEIVAANFVLRAIFVDSGDHLITFEFNPASYRIGSVLSWIFNLLLVSLLIVGLTIHFRKTKE